IGFVGLIVPHAARALTGPDHRWVLPYSAALGALLLVAADVVGRMVARPGEVQVGIVTALIGAPFFIVLVRRRQVASLVNVHARQVIFTSGGTEANNLALSGVARRRGAGRILVSSIEHSAVLGPARELAAQGFVIEEIPVNAKGRITPGAVESRLDRDVILVSVMLANNETGALQDVAEIARSVRAAGAIMHTDAVQAAGKIPLDFGTTCAHLMTLSAHKLYGPKGIGALITDGSIDLLPEISGGGQEAGLRGGTENVAGIVGFGAAAKLAGDAFAERSRRTQSLRDRLEAALLIRPGITIFGRDAERLPNTCQFSVAAMDGESVQMGLDRQGIAVSTGSACHSKSAEPSHVLMAMGVDPSTARGAVRVSFGDGNSEADVEALLAALDRMRSVLPTGAVGW
ncbi:MAG: aminotransferase class V-fold PLP-dependent enzyme, partial [Proteobacteria bacterium]|nr:aminotransferase class V-fold PLP-dependent enzyme [Pseudomonadota bacterium]